MERTSALTRPVGGVLVAVMIGLVGAPAASASGFRPDGWFVGAGGSVGGIADLDGNQRGQVAVLSGDGRRVSVYTESGALQRAFGTVEPDPDDGGFAGAELALGPDGRIAVARTSAGVLELYDREGRLTASSRSSAFGGVGGVDYGPDGRLYALLGAELALVGPGGRTSVLGVVGIAGRGLDASSPHLWVAPGGVLGDHGVLGPRTLIGEGGLRVRPGPGNFGDGSLFAADLVSGGVWVLYSSGLQHFDNLGRVTDVCRVPGRFASAQHLTSTRRFLFAASGDVVRRLRLTRSEAAGCERAPLRIRSVEVVRRSPDDRKVGVRVRVSAPAAVTVRVQRRIERPCSSERGRCHTLAAPDYWWSTAKARTDRLVTLPKLAPGTYAIRATAESRRPPGRADRRLVDLVVP